jgi:hypothetical protein
MAGRSARIGDAIAGYIVAAVTFRSSQQRHVKTGRDAVERVERHGGVE